LIVWATKNITAFAHVVFTALLGARFSVVVALTQRSELIESRERLGRPALFPAALRDRSAVVDDVRRFYLTHLQTRLAQRVHLQFVPA
jgi:hypothetical protein